MNIVLTTLNNGKPAIEKEYQPYGEEFSTYPQNPNVDINYTVNAQERDEETGLIYAGSSYYDSFIAQRISKTDPVNIPSLMVQPQLTNAFHINITQTGIISPVNVSQLPIRRSEMMFGLRPTVMKTMKLATIQKAYRMLPVMNYRMSPAYIQGRLSMQLARTMGIMKSVLTYSGGGGKAIGYVGPGSSGFNKEGMKSWYHLLEHWGVDSAFLLSEGVTFESLLGHLIKGLPIYFLATFIVELQKEFTDYMLTKNRPGGENWEEYLKPGYNKLNPFGPEADGDEDGDGIPNWLDKDPYDPTKHFYPRDPEDPIPVPFPTISWFPIAPQTFRVPKLTPQYPIIRQPYWRVPIFKWIFK